VFEGNLSFGPSENFIWSQNLTFVLEITVGGTSATEVQVPFCGWDLHLTDGTLETGR
jgi:hypothetical protein